MPSPLEDPCLPHRPLISGTQVLNPKCGRPGTLGFAATSNGSDRWIVSCYHVLVRYGAGIGLDGEPVYQPAGPEVVARIVADKWNMELDCAAARCEPGVQALPYCLGIGPLAGAVAPDFGMRVRKAGAQTGVTEGIIYSLTDDGFIVAAPDGFPDSYTLSEGGDSGAVWVEAETGRLVGMLTGPAGPQTQEIRAVSVPLVLQALGLCLPQDPRFNPAANLV